MALILEWTKSGELALTWTIVSGLIFLIFLFPVVFASLVWGPHRQRCGGVGYQGGHEVLPLTPLRSPYCP